MKAKQIGALLLALLTVAVMPGCGTKAGGPSSPSSAESEAPAYPWMAGESPIPGRRIGLDRQGIGGFVGGFAVTETGYYIMGNDPCIPGDSCLFYCDYGSDTVVKLCGRPDCDHLNEDCNALFDSSDSVYYDGSHLFIEEIPKFGPPRVIRMDLDGGNQEVILDMSNFSSLRLGSSYSMMRIVNGIFTFVTTRLNESGERVSSVIYYKLDGSMEEPGIVSDSRVSLMRGDAEGNYIDCKGAMVRAWDPETNEVRELAGKKGDGYYGMEDAWYVNDGVIYHLNYASGEEEVLLDTGLRLEENEEMLLSCFPDHLALMERHNTDDSKSAYTSFYFYNWAMELVGQIDRVDGRSPKIVGETADRLIISTHDALVVPQFYIEKSEFGTGHIELHEFNMPDIDWEAAEEEFNSLSSD